MSTFPWNCPSQPAKPLGVPGDITFDHDHLDSYSYILESYPDVIENLESSLNSSKETSSTRALLGYDTDLPSNECHTHTTNHGGEIQKGNCREPSNEMSQKMEDVDDTRDVERDKDSDNGGLKGNIEQMDDDDDEMVVIDEEEDDEFEYEDDSGDGDSVFAPNYEGTSRDTGEPGGGTNATGESLGGRSRNHDNHEEEEEEEDGEVEEEGEEMEEWDSESEGDLDALLEEGLPDEYKQSKGQGKVRKKGGEVWRKAVGVSLPEGLIGVKEKTVLKKRGQEPLEGLPDGWIRISHQCGMPLYLHRPSRVCTWSRPYLLGSGSSRKHHIPVASIPCLHYRRALEKEKQAQVEQSNKGKEEADEAQKATDSRDSLPNGTSGGQVAEGEGIPMETGDTGTKEDEESPKVKGRQLKKGKIHICEDDSIDGKEFHEYVSGLFEFEKIAIKRFKSWAARRKHTKAMKTKDRPQFPGGPKMIRCQIPGNKGREFVINAQDKTPVCILHEYSQRVMRTQPQYIFGESNNASAPFEAIVAIQGERYGRGEASSKRLAKAEAAKATLDILVPELVADMKMKSNDDTEYFDHVAIDDSRVYDLCVKAGQLTPWQVLQEYRQRSHGLTDTELKMDIQLKNHQRSQYTLVLGPHTVTGMCKNKTTGKQQGAQKLLKQLHPNLRSWGAIIKMYGKGSSEMNRVKKEAEQSVIVLADLKRRSHPNTGILNKLREEMLKAYGEKAWLEEELDRQKSQQQQEDQARQAEGMGEEDQQKEPS